jgi:hypothetical protein
MRSSRRGMEILLITRLLTGDICSPETWSDVDDVDPLGDLGARELDQDYDYMSADIRVYPLYSTRDHE